MTIYEDRPALVRLHKKIQEAVESAYDEPLDDRLTFTEMVGALEFHKAVILTDWIESMAPKE